MRSPCWPLSSTFLLNCAVSGSTPATSLLKPGGRLIITVPAPMVDRILDLGIRLHVLHGMDAESHHGFDPRVIPGELSEREMRLVEASRFEMGLNHLYVFERVSSA